MMKNTLRVVVAGLALIALASCGTSNLGAGAPQLPAHGTSAFPVEVQNGTFDSGASANSVYTTIDQSPHMDKDHMVVNINVDGAQSLKHLYVTVKYDATQYRAMVVQPTKLMGDASNVLSLYIPDGKGTLEYGQTLVNADYQVGFTGSGTVAQISFVKQAEPVVRNTSAIVDKPAAAVNNLVFDGGTNTLTWSYNTVGDYDQNGEANLADLSPLGAHFHNSTATPPFAFDDVKSVIDGDNNGEVNLADLQPLGSNFHKSASGGYHVYHSASQSDVPATAAAPNGAGAAEITPAVALSDAINKATKSTDRLKFSVTVAAPVANDFYWVRPDDGTGALGIASNVVGGNPATAPALSLVTLPVSGAGTQADPYHLDDTVDYTFKLLDHPGGNDVSADPTTVFIVTPAGAGTFTGAVLNVAAGFNADFKVTATFGGVPNHPSSDQYCTTGVGPTNPPVIAKDPADNDWATVTGTGADDPNAYILHTSTFNLDGDSNGSYDLIFNLVATENGSPVANTALDWSGFPPFVPFDAAAFTAAGTAGQLQVWAFSDGYVFGQDKLIPGAPGKSNSLYVAVQSLTP